jgi:hypothetical protein
MGLAIDREGSKRHERLKRRIPLTSVSTDTPSCTRRREKDDCIAQQLDVILQGLPLLIGELRIGWIKFQPVCGSDGKRVYGTKKQNARNFLYCVISIGKADIVVDIKGRRDRVDSPGRRSSWENSHSYTSFLM